jgi:8-oxo-dGTP pyrophosphatase MutT (NUDIX family)
MTPRSLRHAVERAIRRAFHFYWWLARGMTLGVRGLVLDGGGNVFLVKHSYVAGWHLPGGGVEVGETLRQALDRELAEEGNITITAAPALHGMFFHDTYSQRDHIAVFVVRAFRQDAPPKPDHEIIAHGFFPPDELPDDTTAATRRRIAEILSGAAVTERW